MAKRVIQALDQLELAELRKLSERDLCHLALLCAHGCQQAESELAKRQPSFGERRRGRNRDVVSFAGERSQDAVSFAMDINLEPTRSR
jgi:hypothetical protein